MPTTANYWYIRYTKYTYDSKLQPQSPTVSTSQQLVRSRTTPATVSRARPSDLFLSGTARTVSSSVISPQVFSWQTGLYQGGSLYKGYVVSDMWPHGTSKSRYSDIECTKTISAPATSVDRTAMYNSVRNSIREEATNLANMLGEYRETAQTFLDLAKIVSSRGKSLLKRHKSGLNAGKVSVASTAAHHRLAWEYGIRPLANDIGTSVAELTSAIKVRPPFKQGVVRRRSRAANVGYKLPSSTIFSGRGISEMISEVSYKTTWRAVLNQNALLLCLADHGLLNPASVAWEVMPYSFVIDWWFNVGDVLASLDNLLICDKLYVLDSTSTKTFEYITPAPYANTLSTSTSFRCDRSDVRSAPTEISRVSSFAYKPSLSLGHILNGMSLLYVAQGRFK